MSLPPVLQRITTVLEAAGVDYMLTGSFAGAYYGFLRSTQDIDLVITADDRHLRALGESLSRDQYYLDLDAAIHAWQSESMFNIIDMESGWKIDMIFRKSRPFSREEFSRRIPVSIQGVKLYIATAEDVIIAKLEWAKIAQSRRQIEDAAGILASSTKALDLVYLEKWINDLGLMSQWDEARRASQA